MGQSDSGDDAWSEWTAAVAVSEGELADAYAQAAAAEVATHGHSDFSEYLSQEATEHTAAASAAASLVLGAGAAQDAGSPSADAADASGPDVGAETGTPADPDLAASLAEVSSQQAEFFQMEQMW